MAALAQEVITPTVSAEDLTTLQQSVSGFDRDQLIWSSGFLAGLAGSLPVHESLQRQVAPLVPVADPKAITWHVFYATETGNSKRVAENIAEQSRQAGIAIELVDLRDFRPRLLGRIEHAIFVLATHGVGEAPEGTEAFFEFWHSEKAPQLAQLNYGVVALGDSSYVDFCEIGRLFDARLQSLGARSTLDRIDCDLDYDKPAAVWTQRFVEQSQAATDLPDAAAVVVPHRAAQLTAVQTTVSRDKPFVAEILSVQKITGRDSSKDVRHVEVDLGDSGIRYLPGDSLGVLPTNPDPLVEVLLSQTRLDPTAEVTIDHRQTTLQQALASDKEITLLSRPLVEMVADQQPQLQSILEDRDKLARFFASHQLTDLVAQYPLAWQPQEFVDALRDLTPRLYSIASSPDTVPEEAHLTVSVVQYERFGRPHWGSASSFLAGDTARAPVYVEGNDHFRLPADPTAPIIMVGAGTGVAPYRAFIEHRQQHGHTGDNWLVFGERNFASDFLYQLEWLRYRKRGVLDRLDVAFSRDQKNKIYVQHRLLENASAIYDWLQRGAHFYVCGDAVHMAGDVHEALLAIARNEGRMSDDKAREYVSDLKQSRRYQRDVY